MTPSSGSPPPESITVALPQSYPPLAFLDPAGQLRGLTVDRWALWQAKTGIKVNLLLQDWGSAKADFLAGKIDVVDGMPPAKDQDPAIHYAEPYLKMNLVLTFHEGISGIVDAETTRGFVIGVRRDGACEGLLRAAGSVNMKTYPDFPSLFLAGQHGDVRVVCAPDLTSTYYLNLMGVAKEFRQSAPLV
ncbi:MAG TPA: transporter substrate-binding domain-containing protein, partial [Aquabacterium sp.]|nr:transporter substrate-binding domain-containing protein [Aquabacterium sp.]